MGAQDPEVQKLAYSIQFLEDQANVLGQQQEFFAETLQGAKLTQNTLTELETLPDNNEIILPIGNRAFVRALVQDPSKVLIAISKNIIMEKTVPDAQAFTQKIIDDVSEAQKRIQEQMEKVTQQLESLKGELNRRMGGAPQQQPEEASPDF
ncbi:MAG TPA: prefoldin subunit alpha [Candidatus Lokiarchaeia archaeon]|nr:prefoldin subunit alpha [Candidatus Lokiarchaeia archaeon]